MMPPSLDRALERFYGRPTPAYDAIKLKGDASTRSYFRVRVDAPTAGRPAELIVMQLPEDAFGSDEGGAQPESQRLPFLEVAELLRDKGLPTPEVYVEDLGNRVILLEDLGDTTFEQQLQRTPRQDWAQWYGRAIDLLAELHERCAELPAGSIASRRRFDRALLDWELDHFREWGLQAPFGPLGEGDAATLHGAFEHIAGAIEAMPYGFVHRDYQSKNLMVRPSGELVLIDFQDALQGPRVYDLVALLCDSYVALDAGLQRAMVERYAALRRIDPVRLLQEFHWVTLHRKLKDAGRFVYIDRVRKNPDFLRWYPQSLVYVGRAAAELPAAEALLRLLRERIPGFPDDVERPPSCME
mgnify:CR=1 FL=1